MRGFEVEERAGGLDVTRGYDGARYEVHRVQAPWSGAAAAAPSSSRKPWIAFLDCRSAADVAAARDDSAGAAQGELEDRVLGLRPGDAGAVAGLQRDVQRKRAAYDVDLEANPPSLSDARARGLGAARRSSAPRRGAPRSGGGALAPGQARAVLGLQTRRDVLVLMPTGGGKTEVVAVAGSCAARRCAEVDEAAPRRRLRAPPADGLLSWIVVDEFQEVLKHGAYAGLGDALARLLPPAARVPVVGLSGSGDAPSAAVRRDFHRPFEGSEAPLLVSQSLARPDLRLSARFVAASALVLGEVAATVAAPELVFSLAPGDTLKAAHELGRRGVWALYYAGPYAGSRLRRRRRRAPAPPRRSARCYGVRGAGARAGYYVAPARLAAAGLDLVVDDQARVKARDGERDGARGATHGAPRRRRLGAAGYRRECSGDHGVWRRGEGTVPRTRDAVYALWDAAATALAEVRAPCALCSNRAPRASTRDLRLVVHAHCPESLDALFQASGRAGRDGAAAPRSVTKAACDDLYALLKAVGVLDQGRRRERFDVEALRRVTRAKPAGQAAMVASSASRVRARRARSGPAAEAARAAYYGGRVDLSEARDRVVLARPARSSSRLERRFPGACSVRWDNGDRGRPGRAARGLRAPGPAALRPLRPVLMSKYCKRIKLSCSDTHHALVLGPAEIAVVGDLVRRAGRVGGGVAYCGPLVMRRIARAVRPGADVPCAAQGRQKPAFRLFLDDSLRGSCPTAGVLGDGECYLSVDGVPREGYVLVMRDPSYFSACVRVLRCVGAARGSSTSTASRSSRASSSASAGSCPSRRATRPSSSSTGPRTSSTSRETEKRWNNGTRDALKSAEQRRLEATEAAKKDAALADGLDAALKLVDDDLRAETRRLRREARVALGLEQPEVAVFDALHALRAARCAYTCVDWFFQREADTTWRAKHFVWEVAGDFLLDYKLTIKNVATTGFATAYQSAA
ncbi:sulfuric ester hydrolase [Aureococcus anophagefferens]|nr:sulfuric ester hydrolase [Aureococcus anophagefferens]